MNLFYKEPKSKNKKKLFFICFSGGGGGSERGWGEGGPELVNFFHRIQILKKTTFF